MLDTKSAKPELTDAYRWGGLTFMAAVGVILIAFGFEFIGGYVPCPLCLQERYAYYAAIPLLFVGMGLSTEQPKLAGALFLLVALGFLANTFLGSYHAGVEWHFWPGPEECAGVQAAPTTTSDLLQGVARTRAIRCDEAAWRLFGLSFAGWNAVISLGLFATALQAALATVRSDR